LATSSSILGSDFVNQLQAFFPCDSTSRGELVMACHFVFPLLWRSLYSLGSL